MKCKDPTLCYTKADGSKMYRSYSMASALFKANAQMVLNCGKCIFCRKKAATELSVRCVLHASLYEENCFLTLTYDEKREGYHNVFQYSDIQKFKKDLRRYVDYHYSRKIQIFNVHEYGKNGKKHWHLVIFNFRPPDCRLHTTSNGLPLYTSEILQKIWSHGFHTIGSVTEASAMYQSQYLQKDFKNNTVGTAKASHSQHSGIARDYFLAHYKQLLTLGYIPFSGRKIPLPRYFQKLAHKHWSHFNAPENFQDFKDRKKLYSPFRDGEANFEISQLYQLFKERKDERIKKLEEDWDEFIAQNIYNHNPDFVKSAENYLYDLRNKKQLTL